MSVQTEIFNLSVAERLTLVEDIWDSIAKDADEMELSQELRDELDRRMEEHRNDPEAGVTWEKLDSRLAGLR